MKNPFKRTEFDSIIAKGTSVYGKILVGENQIVVVDGEVFGDIVAKSTGHDKSTLVVGGAVVNDLVMVSNVTIIGSLKCTKLVVQGQLAIHNGAVVNADTVEYGTMIIEPSAKVTGWMKPFAAGAEVNLAVAE
jgi:cytoskeletal protein CcmA (bactofilin family)